METASRKYIQHFRKPQNADILGPTAREISGAMSSSTQPAVTNKFLTDILLSSTYLLKHVQLHTPTMTYNNNPMTSNREKAQIISEFIAFISELMI